MKKFKDSIFCAFCKVERIVYTKRSSGWDNFLLSLVASIAIMYLLWGELTPKFLILFVICLTASELFVQLRWRMSLVCSECGFDPAMYVRDSKKAQENVKRKLAKIKDNDILNLSKKNPYHRIAARKCPPHDEVDGTEPESILGKAREVSNPKNETPASS